MPKKLRIISRKIHINTFIRKYIIQKQIFEEHHFLLEHISLNKGKPELWKSFPNDDLIKDISIQYKTWLLNHNYDV